METCPLNKKIIFEQLQRNNNVLQQFGVRQIGLFGSFARNEATANSDIDFLVDFEKKKKTFKNFMDFAFFLEELFQRKVEIVTPQGLSPYIGPHILKTVEYVPFSD